MMDRGVPSEELLTEMRTPGREMFYRVGTSRGKIRQYEAKWTELPWRKVRESVEVKLLAEEGELYVLAKSAGRQAKERAIRRRKLARRLWRRRAWRRAGPTRDPLLMKIGAAKREAGRAFGRVKITVPKAQEEVTRQTFPFRLERSKREEAARRDGHYLWRTNLTGENPEGLWGRYLQLTQIEAAFKCLKSELGIRPIYHPGEPRVEAHILMAFLAYSLWVTLKQRLQDHAPGLTPKALLEKRAGMQMLDVSFPTRDGRRLGMPRYTEPTPEQKLLLHQLQLVLPAQPPPRITVQPEILPAGMLRL
jgi:Transposase DDE domain